MTWSLEQYFKLTKDRPTPTPKIKLKFGYKYLRVQRDQCDFVGPLYDTLFVPNAEMTATCDILGHTAADKHCNCGFHMGASYNSSCLEAYEFNDHVKRTANTLCLFICSGKISDHSVSSFRCEKALFVGAITRDLKIIKAHPHLITSGYHADLENKVREAYVNGYWSGHKNVSGHAHSSLTERGSCNPFRSSFNTPPSAYTQSLSNGTARIHGSWISSSTSLTGPYLQTNLVTPQYLPVSTGDSVRVTTPRGNIKIMTPPGCTVFLGFETDALGNATGVFADPMGYITKVRVDV